MPEAIFTIGIAASGKTTWAHQQKGYIVLDSDQLRLELWGSETEQRDPHKVFDLMYKRGREYLLTGKSVIFCSTNLSIKYRIHAIHQLSNIPNITFKAVVFNTPVEKCRENNTKRERQVPEWLFERQMKQFQCPVSNEGWTSIEVITPIKYDKVSFCNHIWEDVRNFGSQDNPHHSLTLYGHLIKCIDKVELNGIYDDDKEAMIILAAASLHDIGKAYTRTYDDEGIAHYYNHENMGCYLALNMTRNIEIAQLVNYHMLPYNKNGIETWKQRLGDDLWKRIMILHNADAAAH